MRAFFSKTGRKGVIRSPQLVIVAVFLIVFPLSAFAAAPFAPKILSTSRDRLASGIVPPQCSSLTSGWLLLEESPWNVSRPVSEYFLEYQDLNSSWKPLGAGGGLHTPKRVLG